MSYARLRLFWQILLPFFLLLVLMGGFGTFLIVRDLSSRAQTALDNDAFRRAVHAEAFLRDQELYLLESVRFATNIQGLPEAVAGRDPAAVSRRLASVVAVRTDLHLLVATGAGGEGLVELTRRDPDIRTAGGHDWSRTAFVGDVLRGAVDETGDKRVGVLTWQTATYLAVASPVRTDGVAGAVLAGRRLNDILAGARRRVGAEVRVYDLDRRGLSSGDRAPAVAAGALRRMEGAGTSRTATVYVPLELRGNRAGTLAVAVPATPFFASARSAGIGLVVVLLLAMAGVVGAGAVLSRFVIGRVAPLIGASREFGRGDLAARARVGGQDELAEVADVFNQMADRLQASYEELEARVAERTEELQRMYGEVLRASRARDEFFAAISHEFRTPLFAILGHAEMLLDPGFRPASGPWRREFGETIRSCGGQLLGFVNEILDLAKADSGRMAIEREAVDLGALLRDLERTIQALAGRSELEVRIAPGGRLPIVVGDPARLRQVVLNLVSNAIKYTPRGGRVDIGAAARRGAVELSVRDTGPGIPRDAGDRVFEPFYRVEGTVAGHGEASSGLGLALVKRLVEAHGGTVTYESRVGHGTTFRVRLPAARAGAA